MGSNFVSEVHSQHSTLMHYTNAAGLEGIIRSRTLWARHSSFLNDSQEIVGFYEQFLLPFLSEAFAPREASTLGNEITKGQTRDSLVKQAVHRDRVLTEERREFYSLSFCTAQEDFVRANGLLSQWRGYGGGGGYALVFDTKKVEERLRAEQAQYPSEHIFFCPVSYGRQELESSPDPVIQAALKNLRDWAATDDSLSGNTSDSETLSGFFKHQGFAEEREVRVVVTHPGTKDFQSHLSAPFDKSRRPVNSFVSNGVPIPYITLLGGPAAHELWEWSLKKVIVGPHPDKLARKRAVEILLREQRLFEVEVATSDIPFRG